MSYEIDSPHQRLEWARKRAGFESASDFAKVVAVNPTTYRAYENGQNGYAKLAARFAKRLGVTAEWLMEGGELPNTMPVVLGKSEAGGSDYAMVSIPMIDLAYGLGATFSDSHVDVEVLQFPKVWVETITHSSPSLLTWSRGRGDSMSPTIHDGDMVLLDRSQRSIMEQDALWAFTVGDLSAIKRLRIVGSKVIILSDNPNVPPYEEPIDTINIVARVVFIGRRS